MPIINAEILSTGIAVINNRPSGQRVSITKAVFSLVSDVTGAVTNSTDSTSTSYVITSSSEVILKSEVNQLVASDRVFNRVEYYVNDVPFIRCNLVNDTTVIKQYTNAAGFRLVHQLSFNYPNLFNIFNFDNPTHASQFKFLRPNETKFPWYEKQSIVFGYDFIKNRASTLLNVDNSYWICPIAEDFSSFDYSKNILSISGGTDGDSYNNDYELTSFSIIDTQYANNSIVYQWHSLHNF